METIEPDTLLAKPAAVRLGRGIVLSILIHLALIALTSIGLYRAWAKWGISSDRGFHTPGVIKQLEKEAAKAAAEQARAAAAASAAKAEAPATAPDAPPAAEAASAPAKAAPAKGPDAAAAAPQKTPLDSQVEKPPKGFDLDDIDL